MSHQAAPHRWVNVHLCDSQLAALIHALVAQIDHDDRTPHQRRSQVSALLRCQRALADLRRRL